jgi:hypothetical protein
MIEIVGPFQEYKVTLDGFRVPHINAIPMPDDQVEIVLDGRFGMEGPVSREEFNRWLPILANAMAISAGYSCHGENCTLLNQHKIRMSSLGNLPPNLTLIDGGKDEGS